MIENPEQLSFISSESNSMEASDSLASNSFIGKFISDESYAVSINAEGESVIVKNVFQDYKGIIGQLDTEKNDERESSRAITTAKLSLADAGKNYSQEIFHHNVFAVPGKFFCKNCSKEIVSVIRFMPFELGFWDSLAGLFQSKLCCTERLKQPDIVHECPTCQYVLARISAI